MYLVNFINEIRIHIAIIYSVVHVQKSKTQNNFIKNVFKNIIILLLKYSVSHSQYRKGSESAVNNSGYRCVSTPTPMYPLYWTHHSCFLLTKQIQNHTVHARDSSYEMNKLD